MNTTNKTTQPNTDEAAEARDWRELLNDSIIARFPRYFRKLRERAVSGEYRISSAALADDMGIKPSQVRQDLRALSSRSGSIGGSGYGYNPHRLFNALVEMMGVDDRYSAVIIGKGTLCDAVSELPIFTRHGIKLAGRVSSAVELNEWSAGRREPFPEIAVLVTDGSPIDAACMAAAKGVRVIVNFNDAEIDVNRFEGIAVRNCSLGDVLMAACCGLSVES